MKRPEGLDRKISVEQAGKKKISVDRAQVMIMMTMIIMMIIMLNLNKMQVSKLGLAVNSLVFGGFQPVDVLADIRLARCSYSKSILSTS